MIPELLKERTLDQNVIVPRDDQFFALPGIDRVLEEREALATCSYTLGAACSPAASTKDLARSIKSVSCTLLI
jgi:hypothetical protein